MRGIFSKIGKTYRMLREQGLRLTLAFVLFRLSVLLKQGALLRSISIQPQEGEEILPQYDVILSGITAARQEPVQLNNPVIGDVKSGSRQLEFSWIVPYFVEGSGGHKSLFRFIRNLENAGHRCVIYVLPEKKGTLIPERVKEEIHTWFEPIAADVHIFDPKRGHYDAQIAVCTSWTTAYAARRFRSALTVYFVQDYEPLFYPMGSEWYLAERTYRFGYYHVTLAPWLTKLLREKHGAQADSYDLTVERDIYYPRQEIRNAFFNSIRQSGKFNVSFYARNITARRCTEMTVMALDLFLRQAPDARVYAYGWNQMPPMPFKYQNLGVLTPDQLAELYSCCDVCIAPSATNLSLVSREAMACGCVLMDLAAENTMIDLKHMENAFLAQPDPQSMCDGLLQLYRDRAMLHQLKQKSIASAATLKDWRAQSDRFCELVTAKLREQTAKVPVVS